MKSVTDNICEKIDPRTCEAFFGLSYSAWVLIVLGLVLTFFSLLNRERLINSNKKLKFKNEDLEGQIGNAKKEVAELISNIELYKTASQMLPRKAVNLALKKAIEDHFNGNTPNSFRLSVYTHYNDQKAFALIGRYSPTYEFNTLGRDSYPEESAGVIFKAFNNSRHSANIKANPNTHYEAYVRELVDDYRMEEGEVRNLSMKCRALLAKRISGGSSGNVPIGVALIETTRAKFDPIEKDALDEVFKKSHGLLTHALHIEFEFYKMKTQLLSS